MYKLFSNYNQKLTEMKVDRDETVKVVVSEGKTERGFKGFDPINDFRLLEQAYKVEVAPVSDTENELKGLDLNYFVVRGGEIQSKKVSKNGEDVLFNEGLPNEFKIPIDPKRSITLDKLDDWYSSRAEAQGIAKALTQQELKKQHKILEKHQAAYGFLEQQMQRDVL